MRVKYKFINVVNTQHKPVPNAEIYSWFVKLGCVIIFFYEQNNKEPRMQTTKYTPEETVAAVQAYANGFTVEQIAQQLDKSPRSIVAKLVREGVYTKAPKPAARARKQDLVLEIATLIDVDPEALASMEKAQVNALATLAHYLRQTAG